MKHPSLLIISLLTLAATSCSDASGAVDEAATVALDPNASNDLKSLLAPEKNTVNPFDRHLEEAPDDNCERIRINTVGPLRQVFNDSNHVQLEAAQALGFAPIHNHGDIMAMRRGIVEIKSCPEYYLDELTHSFPYLVPEAAVLIKDIGRAFNDSLAARGGGAYRIKVTSVLRTPATVKRLRRVNGNATEESTHAYGTTVDISYSKFICDDPTKPHRTFEDLKNLLAEVLYDMRQKGRCYVKYENRQACFHLTARPSTK